MSESNGNVKLSMMVKKHPNMTEEQFTKYWTKTHPAVVEKWLAKHGIVKYVQYHTPKAQRDQTNEVYQALGGDNISDFDGAVELTMSSLEALKSALADPYYEEHVVADERTFIDAEKSVKTLGWEKVIIDGGHVVRES